MGVYFGFDNKNVLHMLCRDFSRTRTLSRTHVAKTTGKAIASPYFGRAFAPAFA